MFARPNPVAAPAAITGRRDTVARLEPPVAVQESENPGESGHNDATGPTPKNPADRRADPKTPHCPTTRSSRRDKEKLKNPQKPGIAGQNYPPSRVSLVLEEHQMLPAQPLVLACQPHVTLVALGFSFQRADARGPVIACIIDCGSFPPRATPRGRGAAVKT